MKNAKENKNLDAAEQSYIKFERKVTEKLKKIGHEAKRFRAPLGNKEGKKHLLETANTIKLMAIELESIAINEMDKHKRGSECPYCGEVH